MTSELYGEDDDLAKVRISSGRVYLEVGGYIVAIQGDLVRDWQLDGRVWDTEKLEKVARAINAKADELLSRERGEFK